MRTLAAVLVLVAAANSFGAVVDFGPATSVSSTYTIPVAVSAGSPYSGMDLIFQADQPVGLSFAFAPITPAWNYMIDVGDWDITGAPAELWVEAAYTSPDRVQSGDRVTIGTLTVTGVTTITNILVNGETDGISGVGYAETIDPLVGARCIPEPATLSLLALGSLVIARRRRA